MLLVPGRELESPYGLPGRDGWDGDGQGEGRFGSQLKVTIDAHT